MDLFDGEFDVLIVGGGIVGAGVAREAATRGLRTALVERADFASGTSSRSTRLLHGGIRYLAQGRFGLVREANHEKTILHAIAPHLSQPMPFLYPARDGGIPRWRLLIGVKLYDLLCGRRRLGRSRALSRAETLRAIPGYAPDGLRGAVRYYDSLTNDARLVLDTLRSASAAGARVRNYTEFRRAERVGPLWEAAVACRRTDATGTIRARSVVNATGPWSDRIPGSGTKLRVTKGVHLVVDRSRLPVDDALVTVRGKRILFTIPWGERVVLGTTDTEYEGPLDEPPCDAADVRYVLDAINADFPDARLTPDDLVSTWAGLRPLVADPSGDPSDISRRHEIVMRQPAWWDVTGGKLTTYRLMGEQTVDAVARHLGSRVAPSRTATTPLLEGAEAGDASGILPPPVSEAVARRACRDEWAERLDDVMIRRTGWRHYHRDHEEIACRVAAWMAAEHGWTDADEADELRRYRELTAATWLHA